MATRKFQRKRYALKWANTRAYIKERRTPNAEHQTPNAERRTPNTKRRTLNAKRQTPNVPIPQLLNSGNSWLLALF